MPAFLSRLISGTRSRVEIRKVLEAGVDLVEHSEPTAKGKPDNVKDTSVSTSSSGVIDGTQTAAHFAATEAAGETVYTLTQVAKLALPAFANLPLPVFGKATTLPERQAQLSIGDYMESRQVGDNSTESQAQKVTLVAGDYAWSLRISGIEVEECVRSTDHVRWTLPGGSTVSVSELVR